MTLRGSRSKAPDVLLPYRAIGPIRKDREAAGAMEASQAIQEIVM